MLFPERPQRQRPTKRFSLIQKLTILTGTVVIVFMTLFAWINISNLQRILVTDTIRDLDNLANGVIRMGGKHLSSDNRAQLCRIIDEASRSPGVERIRLINPDGTVAYSSHPSETGRMLDQKADGCAACHKKRPSGTKSPPEDCSRFFTLPDGRQVIGVARLFRNEAGAVLGVIDVIASLDTLKSDLSSYRNRIILLTVLLIILLGASLTFFTLHLVNRPVNELLNHTRRISRGELDCTLTPTSNDELGELMEAFQLMTVNLRQARNDLEEWGRTLEEKVKERSEELQRMQMQLVHSEKLASLGGLVAGIAHEINNPLSGILIFSELVAKDKRLDQGLVKDMDTISSEAKRCAGIVKGLLEFARDYQPKTTATDINRVIGDSLRLVECQSVFQNVAILRELAPGLPEILADENQLKQVFINIFINAGQAMQDMRRGEMRIRTLLESGNIKIRISDSGCGVEEEQLGKLFDPFFTTKGTGGTGLGLSVSYGIIKAHGGAIDAESSPGKGTTFIITLPLLNTHLQDKAVTIPAAAHTPSSSSIP